MSLPGWIKEGAVCKDALRGEVACCAGKLSSSELSEQQEGASALYQLIMTAWDLDTHLARDSADIVCEEVRWVLLELCASEL